MNEELTKKQTLLVALVLGTLFIFIFVIILTTPPGSYGT